MSEPLQSTLRSRPQTGIATAWLERLPSHPSLKVESLGSFSRHGRSYHLPHLVLRNPQPATSALPIGIFGGVHGDEPASWESLHPFIDDILRSPESLDGLELHLYPFCNPSGIEAGTRETTAGFDLNRDFWTQSTAPETRFLEAELEARRFQGIIALHADDTAQGLYGYTHGRLLNDALIRPALAAAEPFLPRDTRPRIDGWHAHDGVITDCFCGVLRAPENQNPKPFDIIFETPALSPLELQVKAMATALRVILAEYRTFIAYAQDL